MALHCQIKTFESHTRLFWSCDRENLEINRDGT
ncbi:MAG: hypothetical protein ACI9X4_002936, partial [Glaciecola sp.]